MHLSIFNIFNIGIGPSSSHTVGPMRASNFFIEKLKVHNHFQETARIRVELFGSLALTGLGHGTDRAILAGLEGERAETTDFPKMQTIYQRLKTDSDELSQLFLNKEKVILFNYKRDLLFESKALAYHPNGMIFCAYNKSDKAIYQKTFYSIGGGFIVGKKMAEQDKMVTQLNITPIPFPFETASELIYFCKKENKTIGEITWENEKTWRSEEKIDQKINHIWHIMNECIQSGLKAEGFLPGKLQVKRRAKEIELQLKNNAIKNLKDPLTVMDYISLYALAVNEENASGGRVVTAPTNGAAGIVPAVLKYHQQFCHHLGAPDIKRYLLTAGTIGILYKRNASISGAEVGCQGEVGVACSMAAAGLAELMGGTAEQVENAAEIGMEHNLGLTCDPIEGQVQIPCIERNAMASVKAINAARLALKGSGKHYVSLDQVMQTMKQTGIDMQDKYKETSQGGLATTVNITEC